MKKLSNNVLFNIMYVIVFLTWLFVLVGWIAAIWLVASVR